MRFAGRLQKMSNFNVLVLPSASLAPARRPHPPRRCLSASGGLFFARAIFSPFGRAIIYAYK